MKKIVILAVAVLCTVSAYAQTKNENVNKIAKKVSKFWNNTKKTVSDAGKEIGDAFTSDKSKSDAGLIEIDGAQYMPIYSIDNFYKENKETDTELTAIAAKYFTDKYPDARIISNVIPQSDWDRYSETRNNKVVGYKKTVVCYILARDGEEGYINAKFYFTATRKAGEEYEPDNGVWPSWEKTDMISKTTFEKLTQTVTK